MKMKISFHPLECNSENRDVNCEKYERTQCDKYAIYLNLQNKSGVSLRNDIEELIELTAGICKQLLMQNCSFEVWINSVKDNGLLHIKNGIIGNICKMY